MIRSFLRNLARLTNATLIRTHFDKADLTSARLGWSDLTEAHLREADLAQASFEGEARLFRAHLEGADLRRANLDYAALHEANFDEADLTSADMIPAKRLTVEQLLLARSRAGAAVPREFRDHPDLQERLKDEGEAS